MVIGQETPAWAATLDFDTLDKIVAVEEAQGAIDKGDLGGQAAWIYVKSAWLDRQRIL